MSASNPRASHGAGRQVREKNITAAGSYFNWLSQPSARSTRIRSWKPFCTCRPSACGPITPRSNSTESSTSKRRPSKRRAVSAWTEAPTYSQAA
jgi:hypothetical protein